MSQTPMPSEKQSPTSGTYKGRNRFELFSSASISKSDLLTLFEMLESMADEEMDRFLNKNKSQMGETTEDQTKTLEEIKAKWRMMVMITGESGEVQIERYARDLDLDRLPKRIVSVVYNSHFSANQADVILDNIFRVNLDFSDPPQLTQYNPLEVPTPNDSSIFVGGTDVTWVNGVYESVQTFLRERKMSRDWLHKTYVFLLGTWLVGIPLACGVAFRVDDWMTRLITDLPPAIRAAVDLYALLLSLAAFRWFLATIRWLYPKLELQGTRKNAKRNTVTAALLTLFLGIAANIIVSFLK